jgi:hypothetical protein
VTSSVEADYGMAAADAEVVIAGGCLLHDLGMSIHRSGLPWRRGTAGLEVSDAVRGCWSGRVDERTEPPPVMSRRSETRSGC